MVSYREARVGGSVQATVEQRADGATLLRSTEALQAYPQRLTDALEHWASQAPDRTFTARRDQQVPGGDWQRISYAQMLQRVQAIGQALVDLGLSAERPLVVLSGNDLEHVTLALACQWAGIPYAPVSPAYSLIARDFAKLRHITDTLTPGAIYASGPAFGKAIDAVTSADIPVILADGALPGRTVLHFAALLQTQPGDGVRQAHDAVGPDTIAKFLFTSGSTKLPKAVINTQRMLCANQQMLRQCMAFLADEPPVLVDWLPWNHTFGGNHNVGIALYNGGTLYIDDGKPTADGMAETLRNLREISPSIYFNVPKGFEEIAHAMDGDTALRDSLFRQVKAFMFSGAGLAQAVWDKLDRHAEASIGQRVRVITGLGMTETAPSCTFAVGTDVKAGWIGLPAPGVEVKLVPSGDKTEVRFRGPHVMPGYWRAPEQTAEAFDDEGFYCTGDAVALVNTADAARGLIFDGRIAEDFKLSSGTFVSVGPLRAQVLALGSPLVQDSVVAGINRNDIALLVFPRVEECRRLAGNDAGVGAAGASAAQVLAHPAVRQFFQGLADRLWRQGTGSANRVARLHVLLDPPSLEHSEVTDKGSINQRAVLKQRAGLVDAIYDGRDAQVIVPAKG